jgi:hypothetical protein
MENLSQVVKQCPDCGEGIGQTAGLCRYCGYIFPISGLSGVTTTELAAQPLGRRGLLENLAAFFPRRI